MTRTRYIGFDMDDCVGHVHFLYPLANEFIKDRAFIRKAAAVLATCERRRETGFFRPCITEVMCAVYDAIRSRKIHGAFLFSNNSNQHTVEFVGLVMEAMVQQERELSETPHLFEMAISFHSPERGEKTGIKDWAAITNSLHHHRLPLPTSHSDLLFFDDKTHVLTGEIPHYTVVPAYHSRASLADAIKPIEPHVPASLRDRWKRITGQARGGTRHFVPTEDEGGQRAFLGAIQRFLDMPTGKTGKTGKSRRAERKTRRRTRKNRRL
jgi:hypothetical protein